MFVLSLTIFVLAVFIGFEIIAKVPPTLHTPLMSGSNAISGITIVGAIVAASVEDSGVATAFGFVALVFATINVVGGFLVTHRMLAMFKSKPRGQDKPGGEPMIAAHLAQVEVLRDPMSKADVIQLGYLLAAILFILGLKGLTRPRTAVRGNVLGALGMLVAVGSVMLSSGLSYGVIAAGLAVGALLGALLALRVQMTDMPELVALFNGLGGGASALVAASIWSGLASAKFPVSVQMGVGSGLSMAIGALTLTGSAVAFGKLNGSLRKNFALPAHQAWNALLGLGLLILIGVLATAGTATPAFWLLSILSLVLGVLVVIPIGGADMPVVIALLNSMSGLAAAASGFLLENNALIVSGSLVGASGLILTGIMCKAMNRKLYEVLFKSFGDSTGGPSDDDVYAGKVKSTSAEEIAMLLETAGQVVIVPGYGMAVAQAQHAVRDLTQLLEKRGTKVLFGIHPVAGRMPGHMNVLLAEADIDYDLLLDLDAINPMFRQTDVVIVIGANDVVNPSAREDASSPIYGMPILDVDLAGTVIVVKRSLSAGFAGIPNPLFAADNALMFFDDAKKGMVAVSEAMKEL